MRTLIARSMFSSSWLFEHDDVMELVEAKQASKLASSEN